MKEESGYESVRVLFSNYLEKNQQRKTPERFAILERVYSLREHFDAEFLYQSMKDEYRVSLATVYNTLELLQKAKLIVKHQFGTQTAQYENIYNNTIHNHLICMHCGRIKEFTDKNIKNSVMAKTFANFQVTHYSLYILGKCKHCKIKKSTTKNKKAEGKK